MRTSKSQSVTAVTNTEAQLPARGGIATKEEQPSGKTAMRGATAAAPLRLSRQERRKIATREALIKAVQEVVAMKGVYVAVIEEITERAYVAKESSYQYFRDRDGSAARAPHPRLEELRMLIDTAPPSSTFAERVWFLIRHHLVYFLRDEDVLLFLDQIRGLIKMRGDETRSVREAYRRHLTCVAECLRPNGIKISGKKITREEGACVLPGIPLAFSLIVRFLCRWRRSRRPSHGLKLRSLTPALNSASKESRWK